MVRLRTCPEETESMVHNKKREKVAMKGVSCKCEGKGESVPARQYENEKKRAYASQAERERLQSVFTIEDLENDCGPLKGAKGKWMMMFKSVKKIKYFMSKKKSPEDGESRGGNVSHTSGNGRRGGVK